MNKLSVCDFVAGDVVLVECKLYRGNAVGAVNRAGSGVSGSNAGSRFGLDAISQLCSRPRAARPACRDTFRGFL